MTQSQTSRSRVLRRVGVALAASIAVSTLASTAGNASPLSSATPISGGEIKVGMFDTMPGFCVGNNPANSALMATRSMFEGLVEKTKGNDFVGLLAQSWTNSADFKEWTFKLRENVKFHNGQAFTASSVVNNFNAITGRLAARGISAGTSAAFAANIVSFVAVDPTTVKFTLFRAQNDFPGTIYASGRTFMRADAQLTATACSTTPIGTGPFKVVSWNSNELIVSKNADYWRTDPKTKAKLPYLDKITFTNVKEGSQRAAAVRTGTLDAGMFTSFSEGTFIRDLRQRKSVATEFRSPNEYYPSLWLNQTKPGSAFSNINARKAVLTCIDRVNYVKARSKNETAVADSIVGKNSAMYSKTGFSKFSVAASKKFVAAYKAETGATSLSFSMPQDTSGASQANATFLKRQWAKCGITANVSTDETGVIITKAFNPAAVGGAQNGYDLLPLLLFEGTDVAFNAPFIITNSFPVGSTNPVANAYRGPLGALLNLNHHTDANVDTLLAEGQAATTKAAAKAKFAATTAYVQRNAFMTSINHGYYTLFTGKKLAGIGTLSIEVGKTQRTVTNWGIDWTGVWKKA